MPITKALYQTFRYLSIEKQKKDKKSARGEKRRAQSAGKNWLLRSWTKGSWRVYSLGE